MSLQELINNKLQAEQEERKNRERSGKYNPSNFGRCYRLQVLSRLNIPISNPPNEKGLRKMAQGTATHQLNQSKLPTEMCEIKIETDDVCGYADITEKDRIIDIKSAEAYQVKRFWNKPIEMLLEEKKPNWLQVGWYGLESKKPYIALCPCPFGTFIELEFTILTEVVREEVEEEISNLKKLWENYNSNKMLPNPIPRAFNGQDCTYCSWKDYCMGVDGGYKQDTIGKS